MQNIYEVIFWLFRGKLLDSSIMKRKVLNEFIYYLSYVPKAILINGHVVKEYNSNGQLMWQGNVQRIERSVVGPDVKYLIVQ